MFNIAVNIFNLLNRAMNYGALGFLIARDVLHLLLPDSKRNSLDLIRGHCTRPPLCSFHS